MSHCVQQAFLPRRNLYLQNPQFISLSLRGLNCVFLVVSAGEVSFHITGRAMLLVLGPILHASRSCFHSLDDVRVWSALSIRCEYPPEVAKGSYSEQSPLHFVLTLCQGEM